MVNCLIVDDSPSVRLAVEAATRVAHHVRGREEPLSDHAGDTETARALFQRADYDLVFLDLDLAEPDSDGVRLLSWMHHRKPATPVAIVTAFNREHPNVVRAMQEGAFCYVRKPVRQTAIANVLRILDHEGRSQHLPREA